MTFLHFYRYSDSLIVRLTKDNTLVYSHYKYITYDIYYFIQNTKEELFVCKSFNSLKFLKLLHSTFIISFISYLCDRLPDFLIPSYPIIK